MKVMDNKLFTIEPKTGRLEPGECQTVSLKYKHNMAGTDRLPVLLKLARGREVLVSNIYPFTPTYHLSSTQHNECKSPLNT